MFNPSYLLCPEVYTWHSIEKCIVLLDKNKYNRFASFEKTENCPNEPLKDIDENDSIDNVKIRVKFRESDTKILKFGDFCDYLNPDFVPSFIHLIQGYCKLFGKKVANRILIKF